MRNCCCCVSVHLGSIMLGVVGLVVCVLELVPIVPYLMELENFNPIQDNLSHASYVVKEMIKDHNVTEARAEEIVSEGWSWIWNVLLTEAVLSGIFALLCGLMICGVACRQRPLILPYLVYFMVVIITFFVAGVALGVLLCFVNVLSGSVGLVLVLTVTILMIYFWQAVLKSYIELGSNDYMYSLAPTDANVKRGQFPTPQRFDLA